MISFFEFAALHGRQKNDQLRMGQRFCIMYVKGAWPELFYARDERATALIQQWLRDHQYVDQLPPQRGVDWQ